MCNLQKVRFPFRIKNKIRPLINSSKTQDIQMGKAQMWHRCFANFTCEGVVCVEFHSIGPQAWEQLGLNLSCRCIVHPL